MIDSPLMREFAAQIEQRTWRGVIERVIQVRFGTLPDSARANLESLHEEDKFRAVLRLAVLCPTLEAFLNCLVQETTPAPAPVSSRRRRNR